MISFIDSTPVKVCKNKRIKARRVFKGIAEVGKSAMGWFYGFKLHLVINGPLLRYRFVSPPMHLRIRVRVYPW